MRKFFIIVPILCALGLFASAQDNSKPPQKTAPADFKIPPEAVNEANPVKATPESIERGKKRWGYDCAMCHGANGNGKGDLAADMKLQLGDYRDPKALKDKTDGELFYIIKNGKGSNMPAEGARTKPDNIWDLVNYIRSLAKKEGPAQAKNQTP